MENKSLMEQIAKILREQLDDVLQKDSEFALADQILSLLRSQDIGLTDEEIFNLGFETPYKSMSIELLAYVRGTIDGAKVATAKASLKIAALEEENKGLRDVIKMMTWGADSLKEQEKE